MRAPPTDWLKATFILLAGIVITAVPFVPLRAATPYYKGAAGKKAGGGSTLTDGLIAWFDFDDGVAGEGNDDAHGTYDLSETGPPTYTTGTPNYATVTSSAYFTTPAGLFHSTPAFVADTNADGTILMAIQIGSTTTNGRRWMDEATFRDISLRYLTSGDPQIIVRGLNDDSNGFGALSSDTDLVIGATLDGSADVVEAFLDGTGSGNITSNGTFNVRNVAVTMGETAATVSIRYYWMGVWDRVLTDAEINSATLKSVNTEYSDL